MFRDIDTNTKPISMVYLTPSHTSYGGVNPSFRYYEYNRTSFEVLDYTVFHTGEIDSLGDKPHISNWIMSYVHHTDLNKINSDDVVYYNVEYSAKETYGLPDLSPSSWESFVTQLKQNNTLFQEWYVRMFSGYPQVICLSAFETGVYYTIHFTQ